MSVPAEINREVPEAILIRGIPEQFDEMQFTTFARYITNLGLDISIVDVPDGFIVGEVPEEPILVDQADLKEFEMSAGFTNGVARRSWNCLARPAHLYRRFKQEQEEGRNLALYQLRHLGTESWILELSPQEGVLDIRAIKRAVARDQIDRIANLGPISQRFIEEFIAGYEQKSGNVLAVE